MKLIRSFGIALVCAAAISLPCAVSAQDTPAVPPTITFNGFVSTAYTYNLNKPNSGVNALRVFDFKDNSFKFDVAELVVQRAVGDPGSIGFRIDLTAGSSIPRIAAARGLFRDTETGKAEDFDIQQAYASYLAPLGRGVRFDLGKFVTPAGAEVIEGYDGFNDNYSRSILFGYAIPFTHTGLRVTIPFSAKFTATGMIVNGWDNAEDNNRDKTLGLSFGFNPSSRVAFYGNYIGGNEQSDRSGNRRDLIDLIAVFKPTDRLSLTFNYDVAQEEGIGRGGDDADWSGLAAYLRFAFSPTCAMALRAETFDDDDGVRTGTAGSYDELTVTGETRLSQSLVIRGELRFDQADEKVFQDGGRLSDDQTTVALNAMYIF